MVLYLSNVLHVRGIDSGNTLDFYRNPSMVVANEEIVVHNDHNMEVDEVGTKVGTRVDLSFLYHDREEGILYIPLVIFRYRFQNNHNCCHGNANHTARMAFCRNCVVDCLVR